MRVLKDPDVRRTEILDTAQQLFTTKGYAKATVADILQAAGIAKGTFYYYFKSKEEVMDAVIVRLVEQDALKARQIADNTTLSPLDRFLLILSMQQPEQGGSKEQVLAQIHHPGNAEMQQKSLALGVRSIAPILAKIIEEGAAQGIFQTRYPQEAIEMLLLAGQLLFADSLFCWEEEESAKKASAFLYHMELLLGAKAGSFTALNAILSDKNTFQKENNNE